MKNKKCNTDKLISNMLDSLSKEKSIEDITSSFNINLKDIDDDELDDIDDIDDIEYEDDDYEEDYEDIDDENEEYEEYEDEDYEEDYEDDYEDDDFIDSSINPIISKKDIPIFGQQELEKSKWGVSLDKLTKEEKEIIKEYDNLPVDLSELDNIPDAVNHPKPSLLTRIFHKKIVVEDIENEQLYFILFQIRELYPNKPIRIGSLKGYLSW